MVKIFLKVKLSVMPCQRFLSTKNYRIKPIFHNSFKYLNSAKHTSARYPRDLPAISAYSDWHQRFTSDPLPAVVIPVLAAANYYRDHGQFPQQEDLAAGVQLFPPALGARGSKSNLPRKRADFFLYRHLVIYKII